MQESVQIYAPETRVLESFTQISFDANRFYERLFRLTSFAASLVLFILAAPVLATCALLVRIDSSGPVFFKQRRVGKDGRHFWIWKLRTMVQDAEAVTGPTLSKINDPRVTPIGKFLRNSHLDELPQLINILKGEMSFIGPRPERPELLPKIQEEVPHFYLRNAVHPGVTGLAQVCGCYDLPPKEKLEYDVYWIRERYSLRLNLFILTETAKSLFTNRFNR